MPQKYDFCSLTVHELVGALAICLVLYSFPFLSLRFCAFLLLSHTKCCIMMFYSCSTPISSASFVHSYLIAIHKSMFCHEIHFYIVCIDIKVHFLCFYHTNVHCLACAIRCFFRIKRIF